MTISLRKEIVNAHTRTKLATKLRKQAEREAHRDRVLYPP